MLLVTEVQKGEAKGALRNRGKGGGGSRGGGGSHHEEVDGNLLLTL